MIPTENEFLNYVLNFAQCVESDMLLVWREASRMGTDHASLEELDPGAFGMPHNFSVFKYTLSSYNESTFTLYVPFELSARMLIPHEHPSGASWENIWKGKYLALRELR